METCSSCDKLCEKYNLNISAFVDFFYEFPEEFTFKQMHVDCGLVF